MEDEKIENVGTIGKDLNGLIREKKHTAAMEINEEMINTHWEIGKIICERQEAHNWGDSVVEEMSKELQKKFPAFSGCSAANLWRMRNFYLTYRDNESLAQKVREISWSQNIIIMEKCKDDDEREFYIRIVKKYGFSKRTLSSFIEMNTYEKYLKNLSEYGVYPEKDSKNAVDDECVRHFVETIMEYTKSALREIADEYIVSYVNGSDFEFGFAGTDHRIATDGKEFFIDYLLYQRKLRRYVAMQFAADGTEKEEVDRVRHYLEALDGNCKLDYESPSVGVVVCSEGGWGRAESALTGTDDRIVAVTYPSGINFFDHPEKMIPSPEVIVGRLKALDDKLHEPDSENSIQSGRKSGVGRTKKVRKGN